MATRTDKPTDTQTPPLPAIGGLSEDQVRGAACVYCAVRLDNGNAIDLGERPAKRGGSIIRWFPRACPQHGTAP
ncbi:hypothetical protein ACWGDE_01880 [Streptomyces sp. NPDC054956]